MTGALLQTELNVVLVGFKALFNTILSKESVPLPQIPDGVITNVAVSLKNGYAEIVCDPVFKTIPTNGVIPAPQIDDPYGYDSDYEIFDA